ncbi:MAG: hypothetical protein MUC50_19335 [Myxococcota bacterium]|nr:hypothetical protein [Myxococcota bacterium]
MIGSAVLATNRPVLAQPEWASSAFCRERACVFVEADHTLALEAKALVDTLRLRMCGLGLAVFPAPFPSSPPQLEEGRNCLRPGGAFATAHWWTVHLRGMVADRLLVVIDHLGRRSDEDVVRDLPRGPDAEATGWTVVLAVEEAVSPYLEAVADSAALGSGLGLVEPTEVGGRQPFPPADRGNFPRFSALRAGVALYYLNAVHDALTGPSIAASTQLSPHVFFTFGVGWNGLGKFQRDGIDGTVSHVPLDLLLWFELFNRNIFLVAIETGLSAGFAIYQTSQGTQRRTDILFNPWVAARICFGFKIAGPLRLDFEPGAAVPIFHDVLRNQGGSIYRQDWILASLAIHLAITF